MTSPLSFSPGASLPDLYLQAWESGTVSRTACAALQSCLLTENPDEDIKEADRAIIDRLLYAVYNRRLSIAR